MVNREGKQLKLLSAILRGKKYDERIRSWKYFEGRLLLGITEFISKVVCSLELWNSFRRSSAPWNYGIHFEGSAGWNSTFRIRFETF
ncbi:unnamed protein product [Rhizophagus irregularis]|nr:unnamed protein product [Rhizophagus irregularis]